MDQIGSVEEAIDVPSATRQAARAWALSVFSSALERLIPLDELAPVMGPTLLTSAALQAGYHHLTAGDIRATGELIGSPVNENAALEVG